MYIVCVVLCLFSALGHKVGTLQISIVIIYKKLFFFFSYEMTTIKAH